MISLKGSSSNVTEVYFEGDGKQIDFPLAALKAYGLTNAIGAPVKDLPKAARYPINESPESMYEWRYVGIVMDKKIYTTEPRPGYVVLKNGKRYEGSIKLKKKDDNLDQLDIKTSNGKQKIKLAEIARYGYTVSEASVVQENLEEAGDKFYPGSIVSITGVSRGEVSKTKADPADFNKFYFYKAIFKDANGKYQEIDTNGAIKITQSIDWRYLHLHSSRRKICQRVI